MIRKWILTVRVRIQDIVTIARQYDILIFLKIGNFSVRLVELFYLVFGVIPIGSKAGNISYIIVFFKLRRAQSFN